MNEQKGHQSWDELCCHGSPYQFHWRSMYYNACTSKVFHFGHYPLAFLITLQMNTIPCTKAIAIKTSNALEVQFFLLSDIFLCVYRKQVTKIWVPACALTMKKI